MIFMKLYLVLVKNFYDYIWRYVPNERINYLKLEKIVFDKTPLNNKSNIELNKKDIRELLDG